MTDYTAFGGDRNVDTKFSKTESGRLLDLVGAVLFADDVKIWQTNESPSNVQSLQHDIDRKRRTVMVNIN